MTVAKVAVIMPAFNASTHIGESIASVLAQTHRAFELFVVDDGSTDNTAEIVQTIARDDDRVRYLFQVNQNQAAARNAGIGASRSECVAFIDSDDVWTPNKLAAQLQTLADQHVDVVFSDVTHVSDDHHLELPTWLFGRYVGRFEPSAMFELCLTRNAIPISSVLVKRQALERSGGFDASPEIAGCDDWELWLRLASNGASFYGAVEKLISYRSHPSQLSRKVLRMYRASMEVTQMHIGSSCRPDDEKARLLHQLRQSTVRALIEAGEFEEARRQMAALRRSSQDCRTRVLDFKYHVKLFLREHLGWNIRSGSLTSR